MPYIGVSIAVPDPAGRQLQDYRIRLGDEQGRLIPTHITLSPPYDVHDASRDDVDAHLAAVARGHQPFQVRLSGTGSFRPISPVVFVNVVEGISDCEVLSKGVRTGPLALELEHPYHPHVTIAHHLSESLLDLALEQLDDFRWTFPVTSLWLYEYDARAGWQARREFPLGR